MLNKPDINFVQGYKYTKKLSRIQHASSSCPLLQNSTHRFLLGMAQKFAKSANLPWYYKNTYIQIALELSYPPKKSEISSHKIANFINSYFFQRPPVSPSFILRAAPHPWISPVWEDSWMRRTLRCATCTSVRTPDWTSWWGWRRGWRTARGWRGQGEWAELLDKYIPLPCIDWATHPSRSDPRFSGGESFILFFYPLDWHGKKYAVAMCVWPLSQSRL